MRSWNAQILIKICLKWSQPVGVQKYFSSNFVSIGTRHMPLQLVCAAAPVLLDRPHFKIWCPGSVVYEIMAVLKLLHNTTCSSIVKMKSKSGITSFLIYSGWLVLFPKRNQNCYQLTSLTVFSPILSGVLLVCFFVLMEVDSCNSNEVRFLIWFYCFWHCRITLLWKCHRITTSE